MASVMVTDLMVVGTSVTVNGTGLLGGARFLKGLTFLCHAYGLVRLLCLDIRLRLSKGLGLSFQIDERLCVVGIGGVFYPLPIRGILACSCPPLDPLPFARAVCLTWRRLSGSLPLVWLPIPVGPLGTL